MIYRQSSSIEYAISAHLIQATCMSYCMMHALSYTFFTSVSFFPFYSPFFQFFYLPFPHFFVWFLIALPFPPLFCLCFLTPVGFISSLPQLPWD
jgi:hypothetical protein